MSTKKFKVETEINHADLITYLEELEDEDLIDFILELDLSIARSEFTVELIKKLTDSLVDDQEPKRPWIHWTGGNCPVEKGTLVDVRFRSGREAYGVRANIAERGVPHDASRYFWHDEGAPCDIVAYRLA